MRLPFATQSQGNPFAGKHLLYSILFSLVFLTLGLRVQQYRQSVHLSETLTLRNLSAVAYAAAASLDGDELAALHAALPERDAVTAQGQNRQYDALHQQLADLQQGMALKSAIYTYVPGPAGEIALTVTSAEQPYFRHAAKAMAQASGIPFGVAGQLTTYEDEHGSWLSAFAPVRDGRGAVVAMVQADENFDHFLVEAQATALSGLWWNILLLVLVSTGLLLFARRTLALEQAARLKLATSLTHQDQLVAELEVKREELASKSQLLERSNRDLTDFANIASHDLKSPLRGMANFAQLLARRNRNTLDPSSQEYLGFIVSNSRRALDLVDGLLAYAKSDDRAEKTVEVDFQACAQAATDNLRIVIEERAAVVDLGELPSKGVGNPIVLTQLFQNLIANGLKYNRSASPWVSVHAAWDAVEATAVFSVIDNGIGIPVEAQTRVFEMFQRLHSGEEFEGSGIGLAFCSRLVHRYGGRIWLKSKEGEGSTFMFTLPLAVSTGAVTQEEASLLA